MRDSSLTVLLISLTSLLLLPPPPDLPYLITLRANRNSASFFLLGARTNHGACACSGSAASSSCCRGPREPETACFCLGGVTSARMLSAAHRAKPTSILLLRTIMDYTGRFRTSSARTSRRSLALGSTVPFLGSLAPADRGTAPEA